MYAADTDKRKLLSVLSHGAIFFSGFWVSIGIPIAILLLSEDPVIKQNAKEAIDFHFNVWAFQIVLGVLLFLSLGLLFPLAGLWFLWHWGLTLWAVISCWNNPDTPFRYPFSFHIL